MKTILYIGNKLTTSKSNVSTIAVLGRLLEDEGFIIKYASEKTNKILRLLDMIWTVLKFNNVDYILIDTYSTYNFYYALIISQLSRIYKINYIPILHGGQLENRLNQSPYFSKLIFSKAFTLVAPSKFLKSVFESHNFNNIIFIPNAIKINNYAFNSRPISKIKLLWVRSFNAIYNPKMALLVQKSLISMGYNCELTMIGPTSDNSFEDCKEFAELNELKVHFTGKLSKSEWILLSEQSNIFINTTNFDNTPVSVIEAMALGLPVISTNVGGMPFLIEHYVDGILVDPNDVDNMANEIIRLSQDEQLVKQLTSNARNKVEQFDWNVVKTKWKELLS